MRQNKNLIQFAHIHFVGDGFPIQIILVLLFWGLVAVVACSAPCPAWWVVLVALLALFVWAVLVVVLVSFLPLLFTQLIWV